MNIDKSEVYYYFKNREELICEVVEKFWSSYLENIISVVKECTESSKNKLFKIFEKYSETENYLSKNFNVRKFNYKAIIFLTGEGLENSQFNSNIIINSNNRLLELIKCIIEDAKKMGEISTSVDSKYISEYILNTLQSSIALWAMNQNINIRILFETNFKYLRSSIRSPENNSTTIQ